MANLPGSIQLGPEPETPDAERPPGLTKAELAKALPELKASLKMEKDDSGKEEIVVSTSGGQLADALQRMGFKNQDVITQVNRTPVATADEARKALDAAQNDPGFTVRIIREGRSSWMRINIVEPAPPAEKKPAEAKAPVRPSQQPEPAPAPESTVTPDEKPQDESAEIPEAKEPSKESAEEAPAP